ncbi:MAG TPA: PIN domain-containing protein [Candidatus Fraserbacteria bacterium]|nr:PIN domain-containing protein [Candidatus Fraserbacteria bacterium]
MRLLLDTTIFLEVILEQEKAQLVQDLLSGTEEHEFFLSDYALHSIGLLLFRRKQHDTFRRFLADMILNAVVELISLSGQEMESVVEVAERFNLDFDDAYQYVIAEHYGLKIVSFDRDFDRTAKGRVTPDQLGS